jgi:ribonuclease R
MREHLGEEFGGVVSSVTSFGLFVTLDAMYVEGLIHITELGGEYFKFDEARQELRGERTGIRFALGTRVQVQVSRVDLDGRRIDFRLVRETDDRIAKPVKPRAGAGEFDGEKKTSGSARSAKLRSDDSSTTETGKRITSPRAGKEAGKAPARIGRAESAAKGRKNRR